MKVKRTAISRKKISWLLQQDILDIWNYIADESQPRAKKFIGQIEAEIAKLKKYPQCCPVIKETELLGIEYRQLVVGNYRIIFNMDAENVYIMRGVHSSRILKF